MLKVYLPRDEKTVETHPVKKTTTPEPAKTGTER